MEWSARINALAQWGKYLSSDDEKLKNTIRLASQHNQWFTINFINQALLGISDHYLNADKLTQWLQPYADKLQPAQPKTVALVMAGNIPLVGFHDLIAVLASGHKAQVKLSEKDVILPLLLLARLSEISPELGARIEVTDRIKDFDAVIATGSDNTARYFEYYFAKHPHIIRKNRHSVAVLSGKETEKQLHDLGKDIFQYFGLGCRNVSKLYLPKGYDPAKLLQALEPFAYMNEHNKYKNNLDYNLTLLMMNNIPHYASEFLILTPDKTMASRIATLHYEFYESVEDVALSIRLYKDQIQCIVSGNPEVPGLPFGKAQQPELWDYADNVNTLDFLTGL